MVEWKDHTVIRAHSNHKSHATDNGVYACPHSPHEQRLETLYASPKYKMLTPPKFPLRVLRTAAGTVVIILVLLITITTTIISIIIVILVAITIITNESVVK